MTEEMERPRSGLSVASSIATTTSISQGSRASTRSIKRVHTFGKREYSIKRDPNSPVVIRGWLYKQDSQGLRLWKRRWFVLSDFCLFYYRDSREETVLGSILLPSYEILPANPREVKNRRFSFKAEHPGMRTYYFGADTQEDMNAWIRAMNQSALVVADGKNSHHHGLMPPDSLYASYEDFCHSDIHADDGKSAESLEIAHLSDSRSQDAGSRDSLPGPERTTDLDKERTTDLDKERLFSGLRESLTDAIQHYTTLTQNGGVPPPTPESALKNMEFTYSRQEVESKMSAEGKDSIAEDEEWVPFHKEQPSAELYQGRSPPRPGPNGFECPHDDYHSALSCSAPSSPAMLPAHLYNSDKMAAHHASPPAANKMESMAQRLKASRSQSLPPTSLDVTRHRVVKRSPPPNLKYSSTVHYLDHSRPNPTPSLSSPTRKESPKSPQIQSPKHRAASNEDVFVAVTGSPSLGRITVRSNTPIGRVDILPSEDRIPSSALIPGSAPIRPHDERSGEYYVTNARTRSHVVKSASRPQTPSDRYDVLPSDEAFAAAILVKGANRYVRRSQPLGAEDERLMDGGAGNLPTRHGYARMQMRPNAASERVMAEEYSAELSLTPSMRRHRSQGARYSERSLHPPAAFSARSLGYTPRHLTNMPSATYSHLPPLPPASTRPHVPAGKRLSLSAVSPGPAQYPTRGPYPGRVPENGIDVLLTKLCGQDKLLLGIEDESAHYKSEKEKLEDALQLTHHHLEEFQGQEQVIENIWYQQRMLQDDLVFVRARLCDLSLERDRAWDEYRALEGELHTVRETLERVSQIGHPQEQAVAQRDLWMINDTISGLRFNKPNFHVIPDSARHQAVMVPHSPVGETQPAYQRSFLHPHAGMNPQISRDNSSDLEAIPPRPPLPKDHPKTNEGAEELNRGPSSNQNEQMRLVEQQEIHAASPSNALNGPSKDVVDARPMPSSCPLPIPASPKITLDTKASPPNLPEMGTVRKQRMSAEEQMERMRRHQEAQIHERPKPGVTAQRQNSQRSATGPIAGRLRSSSSSDAFPMGTTSQQSEKPPSDHRKPALVRVTAAFYPSTVPTQPHGKAANHLRGSSYDSAQQDDPTYCVVMGPPGESLTSITSYEISPVVKMTPPLRTTSKIVSAACMQVTKDPPEGGHDNQRERSENQTNSSAQPEQQRPAEKMPPTMSPAVSPGGFRQLSDEGFSTSMEGERERIMSLSYTLATEASELGKIITAKALADDYDANSDVSSSDETYPWDFIMQDSCSRKTPESKAFHFKSASNSPQEERTSTNQDGDSSSSDVNNPDPQSSVGASSPNAAKDRPNKRLLDNLHYENWPGHKHDGGRSNFPANQTDTGAANKCNGQVAKYDFLIEDLHYNQLNLNKVADYCKEDREPIRITLLQSSF